MNIILLSLDVNFFYSLKCLKTNVLNCTRYSDVTHMWKAINCWSRSILIQTETLECSSVQFDTFISSPRNLLALSLTGLSFDKINTTGKLLSSSRAQTVGEWGEVCKEGERNRRRGYSKRWKWRMDRRMQGGGQNGESWVDTKTMGRALNTLRCPRRQSSCEA
jgi:hypothetical protein